MRRDDMRFTVTRIITIARGIPPIKAPKWAQLSMNGRSPIARERRREREKVISAQRGESMRVLISNDRNHNIDEHQIQWFTSLRYKKKKKKKKKSTQVPFFK
jgi:hypothetical protein